MLADERFFLFFSSLIYTRQQRHDLRDKGTFFIQSRQCCYGAPTKNSSEELFHLIAKNALTTNRRNEKKPRTNAPLSK